MTLSQLWRYIYLSLSDNSNKSWTLFKNTVINDPKLPDAKLWVINGWHKLSNLESKPSCSSLQNPIKSEIKIWNKFVVWCEQFGYLLDGKTMWYWRKPFQNSVSVAGMWHLPTNLCKYALSDRSVCLLILMPISLCGNFFNFVQLVFPLIRQSDKCVYSFLIECKMFTFKQSMPTSQNSVQIDTNNIERRVNAISTKIPIQFVCLDILIRRSFGNSVRCSFWWKCECKYANLLLFDTWIWREYYRWI